MLVSALIVISLIQLYIILILWLKIKKSDAKKLSNEVRVMKGNLIGYKQKVLSYEKDFELYKKAVSVYKSIISSCTTCSNKVQVLCDKYKKR